MSEKTTLSQKLRRVKGYWHTPPKGRLMPFREIGAYSFGGMGVHFIVTQMYIFVNADMIPYMYGINILHGRNITLIVTILNLIVQLFFAQVFDNPKREGEKFKRWFVLLGPLTGAFMLLAMFVPQIANESMRLAYIYATCIPAILLCGMWMWIYSAMPAVMTTNSTERTDMLAVANNILSFAPSVMNIAIGPVREYFAKQGSEYLAFRYLGIACVFLGITLSLLINKYVKERTFITPEQKEKIPIWQGLREVFKNKPFMIMILANVLGTQRIFMNSQLTFMANLKFADEYGRGATIASGLSPLVGLGAMVGMIIVPFLARKMENKNILVLGQTFPILVIFVIFFMGGFPNLPTGFVSILLISLYGFMHNFNAGVSMVAGPSMHAEQYDYQQYLTGRRLEGFMNTVTAWTVAPVGALVAYIPTIIQGRIGFQQGEERFQTDLVYLPENMAIANQWFNVAGIITVISAVLFITAILLFYRLTKKEHAKVLAEIQARSVGSTFEDEVREETV